MSRAALTRAALTPRARLLNWLRGRWPDRNPLRRACDRAETAVLLAMTALFLAAAPLTGLLAARLADSPGQPAFHGRHEVTATLLGSIPKAAAGRGYGLPDATLARARWITSAGATRTGEVVASPGAQAGSTVLVWIGRSGGLVPPPAGVAQDGSEAALTAVVALTAVMLGGWQLARWGFDRRRFSAWEAEWQVIGPRWSSRR